MASPVAASSVAVSNDVCWLAIGGVWGLDTVALGRLKRFWPDPTEAMAALGDGADALQGIVRPSHRARIRSEVRCLGPAQVGHDLAVAGALVFDTTANRAFDRLDLDADWPPAISVLGVVGHLSERPSVAIVGMRKCSNLGAAFARSLAGSLVETGAVVVSGLAFGIDRAAHAGALDVGGPTVAVLAGGVSNVSPRRHQSIADSIVRSGGALVSHVPPRSPSPGWRFPVRNRLIAGLADVVVVVEAAFRGGALSTARHARDLGRTVMAVPGRPGDPHCEGTNALIADGAEVCRNVDDVLTAISLARPEPIRFHTSRSGPVSEPAGLSPSSETAQERPEALSAKQRSVLDLIGTNPILVDEVIDGADVEASEVIAALACLELAGVITFPTPATTVRTSA